MNVLGIMSGTSLDGLDLALVQFPSKDLLSQYKVLHVKFVPYPNEWIQRLNSIHQESAEALVTLDIDLGKYIASAIDDFKTEIKHSIDLISSHGHTVFHQPMLSITTQIGSSQYIACASGIETIGDFRTKDVCLNGNGAPLVPIGDHLLFKNYDACINIGGIANISFILNHKRVAFDICPANMLLNQVCRRMHLAYDDKGALSANGQLDLDALQYFHQYPYYKQAFPKSLGRETIENYFFKTLDSMQVNDALHTAVIHIAYQIGTILTMYNLKKVLVTGGGAKNDFLIHEIEQAGKLKLAVPDEQLIDFKEAIVFAFLGYLRKKEQVNILSSVTGAIRDSCSGVLYYP